MRHKKFWTILCLSVPTSFKLSGKPGAGNKTRDRKKTVFLQDDESIKNRLNRVSLFFLLPSPRLSQFSLCTHWHCLCSEHIQTSWASIFFLKNIKKFVFPKGPVIAEVDSPGPLIVTSKKIKLYGAQRKEDVIAFG